MWLPGTVVLKSVSMTALWSLLALITGHLSPDRLAWLDYDDDDDNDDYDYDYDDDDDDDEVWWCISNECWPGVCPVNKARI